MALRANVPVKLGPLVSISVSIETAVAREESLHTVCTNGHDAVRIKQIKKCPSCEATEGFKSGQLLGGAYTVVDKDAVKEAVEADQATKDSLVITAHELTDVMQSTLPGDTTYFLTPSKGHEDSYGVLRALVAGNAEKALCTVFAPRGKPSMWRLGVFGDAVTLNKLVWPEDVKRVAVPTGDVDEATLAMAGQFLDTLQQDFDPAAYRDTAKLARAELLADGDTFTATTASTDSKAAATDLLSAFKASVEQAESKPKRKAAPRKRATKKVAA